MGLRINGSDGGLLRGLRNADTNLQRTLLQLSTGLQINIAADGPAALAISEELRAAIASQNALIENTQRAVNLAQTADGAIAEINAQLNNIRGLAVEAGNTALLDENAANAIQAQIDDAVASINRIAENTQFGTRNLLNGDLTDTQFQITEGAGVTLSVPDLRPENLGTGIQNASGFASLAEIDVTTAQGAQDALGIIDAAQGEVVAARADIGAFQSNVLESNLNSLQIARENLLSSESRIRDLNFAEATARASIFQTLLRAGVGLQNTVQNQRAGLFLNLLG